MQVTSASPIPAPRHKPRVIKEASLLTASGLVELPVEPGTRIFISPASTTDIPPLKPSGEEVEKREPVKPTTFDELLKAAGGGGAGGVVSGSALKLFKLGRATTKPELVSVFTSYNITPNAADTMADKVLELCQTSIGKAIFLGVAGGGAVFSLLRLVKPRWSLKRRLLLSSIVVLLIAILYFVLSRMNITT